MFALLLSALGTPILKALVDQGGHLGLTTKNAISYCNVFFVGNLCSALVACLYFRPKKILQTAGRITRERWKSLAANILYANVISPILIIAALEDAGQVTTVIMLLQTNAVFYALFAYLFDGEKVSRQCQLGLALIWVGVIALIFWPGATPLGYMHFCAIGAAACNALGSWLARKTLDDDSVMPAFLVIRNLIGAVVFFGLAMNMFGLKHFAHAFTPGLWELMLIYAAFVVVLAQITWFHAVAHLSSETISKWSPIVPVLALFFAWLLVGEIPTSVQWVGIAIVLTGTTIAQLRIKRHAPDDEPGAAAKASINAKPLTGA